MLAFGDVTFHSPSSHDFEQAGTVLRRAGAYVTRFEQTFSSVIWHERYTQVSRQRRQFASSGGTFSTVAARRSLESELFLAWIPHDASWIAVRDVISVDGVPRPAGDRRLQSVLSGATVSSVRLRQLATENGRFNVGTIVHSFNEPTLALLFLDERYRQRFTFQPTEERTIHGRRALACTFIERERPTVIQDGNHDVPAKGTMWIDVMTGTVLQTRLELMTEERELRGQMTVQYGPHPRFDVLVPMEMHEAYASTTGEEINTVATYSDFRRFQTGARLIVQ